MPERKKFASGEYVITNTGGGDRLAVVVADWWTTAPHEVRLDFPGGGSRLDVWFDACRLATLDEIDAALAPAMTDYIEVLATIPVTDLAALFKATEITPALEVARDA